jgi:hypothetical protein
MSNKTLVKFDPNITVPRPSEATLLNVDLKPIQAPFIVMNHQYVAKALSPHELNNSNS